MPSLIRVLPRRLSQRTIPLAIGHLGRTHGLSSQGYGDPDGDPDADQPRNKQPNPSARQSAGEHPGPEPVAEGRNKSGHHSSTQSPADASDESRASKPKDAVERTSGKVNMDRQDEATKRHNEEFERGYDRTEDRWNEDQDKVDESFWKGEIVSFWGRGQGYGLGWGWEQRAWNGWGLR
jgi:hypothetical protein